jgi:hypothetical protein
VPSSSALSRGSFEVVTRQRGGARSAGSGSQGDVDVWGGGHGKVVHDGSDPADHDVEHVMGVEHSADATISSSGTGALCRAAGPSCAFTFLSGERSHGVDGEDVEKGAAGWEWSPGTRRQRWRPAVAARAAPE